MTCRRSIFTILAVLGVSCPVLAQAPAPSVAPVTSSEMGRATSDATSKAVEEKMKKDATKKEEEAKEKDKMEQPAPPKPAPAK